MLKNHQTSASPERSNRSGSVPKQKKNNIYFNKYKRSNEKRAGEKYLRTALKPKWSLATTKVIAKIGEQGAFWILKVCLVLTRKQHERC